MKFIGLSRVKTLSALSLLLCLGAAPQLAHAQALLLSVNGSPVTTYDVAQRMKLLRILKKPASRQAAIDNLIEDRLKIGEVSKFSVTLTDADISAQGALDAKEAKIPPAELAQELQRAGIDQDNWRDHFKAQAEWNLYVKALNKAVDVSAEQVRTEMAKRGQSATLTEYVVRQIVIVTPDPAGVEQKMREATQLRARFTGCDSGVSFARGLPDVVVENVTTRTSANLSEEARGLLDKTAVGHLTPPDRSAEGIQMLAVCGKRTVHDDTAAGADVRNSLIEARLAQDSAQLLSKLRADAVIVRH